LKVLTIDDEIGALEILNRAVQEAVPDATIRGFSYTSDALAALREENFLPDVAFLDVKMPEMTGLELAKHIKDFSPSTNIIFVTAYSDYSLDAFRLRASGYVLKPATRDAIEAELGNLRCPVQPAASRLRVKCFGNFEVYAGSQPLRFEFSRTKELFAYLVDRKGAAAATAAGTVVTVPVFSDEGNTHATVSVKDSTATVSATEKQIKEVISDNKDTGTVVLDISNLDVNSAVVPAALVSAAQKAEGSTGLTVSLPTGSVTLDKTALDSTGKNDVKIGVELVDVSKLNDAQKEKLGEQTTKATIVDINVYVNNVLTHTFNDGKIDVSVPYTLKTNENADTITVWYLADDGSITPMHGVYDSGTKTVSFTTTHLSSYVIANFPFVDVPEDAWYYGSVAYVYTHGLFGGTANATFSPTQVMTRGMIVTVLWRMEGKPAAAGASAFPDVKSGTYCADAVAWATENGIVLGYGNGNYGPNDGITREQMAAILYRYAKHKNYDVSVGAKTDIRGYDDIQSVSEYAMPAMQWACGAGLVKGSDNKLMPSGNATRAQTAAILTRLYTSMAK